MLKAKSLAIVLLVLLAGGFAFASGTPEGAAAQQNIKGTTITVLSVQDPFYWGLEALNAQFEKETGVKVKLEPLSYDALMARLTTSFITKESDMDVVIVDDPRLAQFADNAWIIPLTEYLKKDKAEVDIKDFLPMALHTSCIWRGQVWTLPIAMYTQLVMYRTDLLKKAGLKAPPKSFEDWWTWDKYMEYVKSLAALGNGVYGTVIVGAQPAPVTHMYTGLEVSKGVRWFKSFPGTPWDFTPSINTPQSVNALNYYLELYKYSPQEAINYVWFDAGTAFSTKDIGIFYWWSPYATLINRSGYMTNEKSKNVGLYDYAVMPQEPGVEKKYAQGGWSLGIPAFSKNKIAAWAYIKKMTSYKYQKGMGLDPHVLQCFNDFTRTSCYADKELQALYPSLPIQQEMAKFTDGKTARPHFQLYPSLEGIYGLHINMALAGQETTQQALENIDKQFQIILKQNYYLPFAGKDSDESISRSMAVIDDLAK